MPELPEVETICRDLSKVLRGQRIKAVQVRKPKMVQGASTRLITEMTGRKIEKIKRRGKMLIVEFTKWDRVLLIHLKMTGQLIYRRGKKLVAGGHGQELTGGLGRPTKHTHIVVDFAGGAQLLFNDLRQFGWWRLADEGQLAATLAAFGPEPMTKEFTPEYLARTLKKHRTSLKSVLLNQQKVAGLGNIYVDESCHAAGIRPTRSARRITTNEVKQLHRSIERIIARAIEMRGTTFGTYRDGLGARGNFKKYLKVYGRGGERCYRSACRQAGAVIVKKKAHGRGTAYCPNCQS